MPLLIVSCLDAPIESVTVDANVNTDSCSVALNKFLDDDLKTVELNSDDLARIEAIRRVGGEPSLGNRITVISGGLANDLGEIGLENIRGKVGDEVEVSIAVMVDHTVVGRDGVQAFGLDLIFPNDLVEFLGGSMGKDIVTRQWYMGGDNSRVIDGVLYVRVGAFAGSGTGIYGDEYAEIYNLRFRIKALGVSQVILWHPWDHIEWYQSDEMPMPLFEQRSHVWGCARNDFEHGVAMSHPISYSVPGNRHVAHVYAAEAWRRNGGLSDFSFDVTYPLSCDFVYSEAGVNVEHFESVTATEIQPGLIHVVGILGGGEPDTTVPDWGQILRLDFVPHATGVVEHWYLSNFGGDLDDATTHCNE
jgi:hypothetical protein